MRGLRGFTLIEIMIGIAIVAIVLAVPFSAANSFEWLRREKDYRFALRNARHQLEALRAVPYDSLPPRRLRADAAGWVALDHPDVMDVTLDGTPAEVVEGRVRAEPGREVLVDYRFCLPDSGEGHTVPEGGSVTLFNGPVVRVVRVALARGDVLEDLAPGEWSLEAERGVLSLPERARGRVVVVDYLGERIRNVISARALDEDLRPTAGTGAVKLVKVEESYGGQTMRMSLTMLKVKP